MNVYAFIYTQFYIYTYIYTYVYICIYICTCEMYECIHLCYRDALIREDGAFRGTLLKLLEGLEGCDTVCRMTLLNSDSVCMRERDSVFRYCTRTLPIRRAY